MKKIGVNILLLLLLLLLSCKKDGVEISIREDLNKLKINSEVKKVNSIYNLSLKKPYNINMQYHEITLINYLNNSSVNNSIKYNVFLDKEKDFNVKTYFYNTEEIKKNKFLYTIKKYKEVNKYIIIKFKNNDYFMLNSFFEFTVNNLIIESSFNNYNKETGELLYNVVNTLLKEESKLLESREAHKIYLGTYNFIVRELKFFKFFPKNRKQELDIALNHLKEIWRIARGKDDIEQIYKKYYGDTGR